MALKYIDELTSESVKGKRIIARFDFNVPLKNGQITDPTRIDRSLDTIRFLLELNPKNLIIMSHLGRPKGEVKTEFSLEPVATYLAEKLDQDVVLTESCLDQGIKTLLELPQTKIVLLQNLRFHPEEMKNDLEFAKKISRHADIYVNDAFGAVHRKHASTYGINTYFKNRAYGGFLMKREIEALNKVTKKPKTPFCAVVGGAKVSDKIKIIESLLTSVDSLLIGGAMAYPFLKAKGFDIGKSMCSDEDTALAKQLLTQSLSRKIVLPTDHIVSTEFGGKPSQCDGVNISDDYMGLDIGPQTLINYQSIIKGAKTILWNGPMGIFENDDYSAGTFGIAETLAGLSESFTLVGGGDSVAAVNKGGYADKINHVSTGGGASLEYIENGSLPGIQALRFGLD